MPLLKPELSAIHRVLQETGISEKPKAELSDRLDSAGLSLDNLLESLSGMVQNAGSDHLKMRGVETGLKMHGVLRDAAPPMAPITITIMDPYGDIKSVNPILLPRQFDSLQNAESHIPKEN